MTVGSALLILAAQASRWGAFYYGGYRTWMRTVIWGAYHVGLVALLAGLGAALAPLEGKAGTPGVAGQQFLRWLAVWVAFGAAAFEVGLSVYGLVKGEWRTPAGSSSRPAEVVAGGGEVG